jgi:lipoprotein-anchoring transpeptidase ErfK/SrfK
VSFRAVETTIQSRVRRMQRTAVIALALCAGAASAAAEPLVLEAAPSSTKPHSEPRYAVTMSAIPQAAEPTISEAVQLPPQPVQMAQNVSRRGNLGGGFIEFLFSGSEAREPQQVAAAPLTAATPAAGSGTDMRVRRDAGPIERIYAPTRQAAVAPVQRLAPARTMDPRFLPTVVPYAGTEAPGTIIINTEERYLYLVTDGGMARRYGIGVGRPGFTWAGTHKVTAKRHWPDWYPPEDMLKRRPDLPHFMAGGPQNPLGARALYLGSTLYRIHGSNEPWTIGQAVSSGCIRMRNEDVIDLYERVAVGTKVVVI